MITLKCLTIFLFFPFFLFAGSDYQFWFEGEVQVAITKKVDFEWRSACRIDRNASRFHFVYQQIKFVCGVGETWAVAPGYRQVVRLVANKQEKEKWAPAYEPIFDSLKWGEIGGVDWEYRNRFQYIFFDQAWNNRNRFLLRFPKWGPLPLRLVLYEEIFYRLFKEIDQHRHYIGCELEIRKKFAGRLGYLLRYVKGDSRWFQQNILFLELYYNY